MGSTGANRGGGSLSGPNQPTLVQTPQQAVNDNNQNFQATDMGQFPGGKNYYKNQTFTPDTAMALRDYLHDQPSRGSIYSPSQQLNYALETGQNLTANQRYMTDSLMEGMHNLGYDMNLTHYGRVDIINGLSRNAGLNITSSNFENMTPQQLQQFVGTTHSFQKFLSTSYNNFKRAPNGGRPFTDKAVKFNIKAPASTQGLMPGIGPGGDLGEMIIAPGQNFRITGVRFTGNRGRSGANSYKQIEFDIQFY